MAALLVGVYSAPEQSDVVGTGVVVMSVVVVCFPVAGDGEDIARWKSSKIQCSPCLSRAHLAYWTLN